MKYNCKIAEINEEYVTVQIGDIFITGFVNCGVNKKIGQEAKIEILLYDDLKITQCEEKRTSIERKGKSLAYSIFGILDIENRIVKSSIDFEIDEEELYNYGYMDGTQVKIDVLRIDFYFEWYLISW